MSSQREAIAYGNPQIGGWAIGGANAHRFPLLAWSLDDDLGARSIRITFAVQDTDNADRSTQFEYLRDWLEVQGGNLALTVGVDRTITVSGVFVPATRILTLTRSAGDSFAATDVGLPFTIGTMATVQVSRFIDASTVEAIIPPGLTPPAIAAVASTFGEVLIRCVDLDGSPTPIPIKIGGIHGRTAVSRTSDSDDDENRRVFSLRVVYEVPAGEVRPEALRRHRRRAVIERTTTQEGLIRASFSGEITAGVEGGVGKAAKDLISASLDAWIAAQLALLDPVAVFEPVGDNHDRWDDEDAILSFRRSFEQKLFPDLSTALDDPRIRGAQVVFTRQYQNVHGIKNARQPFSISISYAAGIKATGVGAVPFASHLAFWGSTIKPYLLAQARAAYGGTPVVMGGSDPVFDPVASKLRASLLVLMANSGSNVYQYSRTTSMQLSERLELDDIWDGKDFTLVQWSPGRRLVGRVDVQVVQLGEPDRLRDKSGAGNALVALPGGGIFFSGGALSLELPSLGIFDIGGGKPSENATNSPSRYEVFPDPGDPSRFFGSATPHSGKWVPLDRGASETPTFWGEDPDDAGNRIEVATTRYTAQYVYIVDAKVDPATPRDPTKGITSGASKSKTVERPRAK
jgi:hypothetical protein